MFVRTNFLSYILKRTYTNVTPPKFFRVSWTGLNKAMEKTEDWKKALHANMKIFPDFIIPEEEDSLLSETEPYMKRLRYEFSHWDDAIHGYRETERRHWNEQNTKILDRVRKKAFAADTKQLLLVHILDLTAEGWIKPHVDSIKFCGDTIAGLSLLSDSVMRLTKVGQETECKECFFLPRRSLYIMSGIARYDYNHEILKDDESYYKGQKVPRGRRISIICRNEPNHKHD